MGVLPVRLTSFLAGAAVLALAACTAAPVGELTSSSPSSPKATTIAGPTPSAPPTPTVEVDLVEADWTRAIEEAVAGRDVSVAVGVGDRILFELAGERPRIPASNQKLLTSMAALDILGPGLWFPTVGASVDPPKDGVIHGDLWLVGSGDPEVDPSSMARLAVSIQAAGVTRITGDVLGDTSAFTREWWAPGWVPGLSRSYVNRTTALAFDRNGGAGLPEQAAAASLTAALRSEGVEVEGEPSTGDAPHGLDTVASIRSRPLRDLLATQNRGSVNFYAETLLKALGGGSTAAGAEVVEAWAASRGVTAQVRDGSGLSHLDLISTQDLVTLLLLAQDESWGHALYASLAAPDVGTMDGRLLGISVRAKTGTLFETPVSSLSGYVTDASGVRVAFSVISRGLDKGVAIAIEDAIVRTLAGTRIGG